MEIRSRGMLLFTFRQFLTSIGNKFGALDLLQQLCDRVVVIVYFKARLLVKIY